MLMLNQALILTLVKKLTIKILNLKLVNKLKKTSKYNNIFGKGYVPNWSEDVFEIKKVKNTVLWTFVFFDNWYRLHARLMSNYKAWSYKKKKHKKIKTYTKSA